MILTEAQEVVAKALTPFSYDSFFDDILGQRPLALTGGTTPDRAALLGPDPARTILAAYRDLAPSLTCHIDRATAPAPTPRPVDGPDSFLSLIREYHARGYTVRVPEVTNLAPGLNRLTRALEMIVGNPAGVVIFWSAAGARAPIHHDKQDVIAIQLAGRKRWFVSNTEPGLLNEWKGVGEGEPALGPYSTYDMAPGDLLYVPRGTPHTVESTSESIHLAIGFQPVTIREAISAALDHLSDLDRPLRTHLGSRADCLAQGRDLALILEQIRAGINKLQARCTQDGFIQEALDHRHARMLLNLPKIPAAARAPISLHSTVRHSPLATARLTVTPDIVDFRQPGEQILVHRQVAPAMRFIAETPVFRVADLPGDFGADIRIALVSRLLASGFLEATEDQPMPLGIAS